jgi:pimeloyl-ACP methyl ester carboxylesterase
MESLRIHGQPPYHTVVIHGGPGALGEMQPVAERLSKHQGTLEPLLSATTIEGQIDELHAHLQIQGAAPYIVIGHSWGAWLGYLYAARFPDLVRRLILISSGPFEDRFAPLILQTRLQRLSKTETEQLDRFQEAIDSADDTEKNRIFTNIGDILFRADTYQPITIMPSQIDCRYDVFKSVWAEAEEWRRTGKLLQQGRFIRCPVTAIHGEYDPHPFEGVQGPLSRILMDFNAILLSKCGHYPWLETEAREEFYRVLSDQLMV